MEQVRVSLAGLLVVLGGCGSPTSSPVAPVYAATRCPAPGPPTFGTEPCTTVDCGGNSPVANGFPINGLVDDGSGRCNPEGVQLLPRSLSGGGCGSGADLGLDASGTHLVGTRDGKEVCTGEQLAGATFTVRSFARSTLTLTIASVRWFSAGADEGREGYRIESSGQSACEPGVAERIQRRLGLLAGNASALPVAANYGLTGNEDLVIPIRDQLYDEHEHAIPGTQERWLNLACVGDALAKRSLYKLYVPGNEIRNETALKMITANYCGKSYTVRGALFAWVQDRQGLEARWADGKAVCLNTPRLKVVKLASDAVLADLPNSLQPGDCATHRCEPTAWIEALRAECKLQMCPSSSEGFDFESYYEDGTKEIKYRTAPEAIQAER